MPTFEHSAAGAGGSRPPARPEVGDGRLQAVLARSAAGQPLTVAMIGGSITSGRAAQALRLRGWAAQPLRLRGWATQVGAWLGRRGPVRVVDAGVSGTDSLAALHRVQAHVLDARPDLVIVEFGVDDEGQQPAVRAASYEALLRRLHGATGQPAVLTLHLTQRHGRPRGAVEQHLAIARRLGLMAIDVGAWLEPGRKLLDDEPVHPSQAGHDRIAQAVIGALECGAAAPRVPQRALPPPDGDRAYEFTRLFDGDALTPWRGHGFERGGEVHPEWATMPGGQVPGWASRADDGEASFLVWGTQLAVLHAQSAHHRDLEAWVDDGPVVMLRGHVASRLGGLGWAATPVGRDLEPGAHLLHVRVKRDDGFAGSGRPASLLAVMAAGLLPPALHPGDFTGSCAAGGRFVPADDARLRWVGRFERKTAPARVLMAWSGSELRARFSGSRLALRLAPVRGARAFYTVEVDGRRHVLSPEGMDLRDWVLRTPLGPGVHELRLLKRTEASMAEAEFHGLLLAPDGELLPPPPPRALRLDFYGDSITAGACNGDLGPDQYDDLSTHDGTRAYGALTAARLGADYRGFAISGTGITATWGDVRLPLVWNRTAARLDAPVAADDEREPDLVLVNLGQNDHGFPASQGRCIAPDFAPRYLAFVRELRARHRQAKLVLLIGGMPAAREEPAVPRALADAAAALRAEGDARVWTYTFDACSDAHPRIDVHQRMADELVAFLNREVMV